MKETKQQLDLAKEKERVEQDRLLKQREEEEKKERERKAQEEVKRHKTKQEEKRLKKHEESIVEEMKFPTKDSKWIQKVLIGGILGIIPIINFIEYGYILKVMKGAIDGNSGMPKWEDWGNLFINGLIAFVISLIYLIIPILIISVSAGLTMAPAVSGNMNLMTGAIGGILIGLLLALVFGFMVPMALAMYLKENSFSAAFRIGEVLSRIKSVFADYITVYVVLIVLLFILGLLNFIPFLGLLILIFGTFYVSVATFFMFGKVYARSSA